MTDRELMQQALRYMESVGEMDTYPEDWAIVLALRERLAQPEPEPVAWRITDGEGGYDYRTELPEDWSIQWSARYGRKYEPLYTAPRQWQGLTDEEIQTAWASMNHDPAAFVHFAGGALWAEAKCKEKNG